MRNIQTLHITIQRGEERPNIERCVGCCSLYHCPFCVPEIFKPTSKSKCWKHLEGHKRRAVQHKEYFIYKCNLTCSSQAHFHCVTCTSTFVRREWFIKHLQICEDGNTRRNLDGISKNSEKSENSFQKNAPLSGATGVSPDKGVTEVMSVQLNSPEQQCPKYTTKREDCASLGSKPACQINTVQKPHDHQLHVTIQRGEQGPKLERCVGCCSLYHCPFCVPEIFKPTSKSKCWKHLKCHKRRAVKHKDYFIYKCNLKCSTQAHFHCITCTSTFVRREWFLKHLKVCEGRRTRREGAEVIHKNAPSLKVGPLSGATEATSADNTFEHLTDLKSTLGVVDPLSSSSAPHTPAASPLPTCTDSLVEKDTMVMPDDRKKEYSCFRGHCLTAQRVNEEPLALKCQECCSLYYCPFSSSKVFQHSKSKDEVQRNLQKHCAAAVQHKVMCVANEHGDIEETLVTAQEKTLKNTVDNGVSQSSTNYTNVLYGNTSACCTEAGDAIQTLVNQLLSEQTHTDNAPSENTERKRSSVIIDLCPWCGLELNRKNLLTHIRRKHPKETETLVQDKRPGLNSHSCPVCSLSLLRKNLPHHLQRKHPEKVDRTVKKLKYRKSTKLQQPSQRQTVTRFLNHHILDSFPNPQTSTTSASAALPSHTDSPAAKLSCNLPKVQCSVCAATMLKKNLSVHMFRKHKN